VRLFFAVELPTEVRLALGRLRGEDGDYRWVDPSSMHVTLAFLGEQSETARGRLEQLGVVGATSAHAVRLQLGEAGSFGPRTAPRVLWVGLAGELPALGALQSTLSTLLRDAGFSLEDRPFSPHITLARRRNTARSRPIWPPSDVPQHQFTIAELILFQSQLSPKGATYTALGRFPLGG